MNFLFSFASDILRHLRNINYLRLNHRKLNKVPWNTKYDFTFQGFAPYVFSDWDIDEQILISKLLPSMDLFINVGANYGYYCLMAQSFGKKTIAFEPHPLNYKLLKQNIINNNYRNNIAVFPVAVGNVSGLINIYGAGGTASLNSEFSKKITPSHLVPIVRLDDVILGNAWVSGKLLILIDVECWEKYVLLGADKLLIFDPKPIWIIEVLPPWYTDGISELEDKTIPFMIMNNAGYKCFQILPNEQFMEMDYNNIEAHMSTNMSNHNYIFVDKRTQFP